jgi:undecaprenyl pyrophosphate synthase
MTEKIKAALILDSQDFILESNFIEFNKEENIDLSILQRGQGRKNFLAKVKNMLLSNKEGEAFSEDDIKALEEELDLVIKLGDTNSLEDSLVTGLNYAEIIFIKKSLRNFSITDYQNAIEEFKNRKRNFGK